MPRFASVPYVRQKVRGGTFLFRYQLPKDVHDALRHSGHLNVPRTLILSLKTSDATLARSRSWRLAADASEIVTSVRNGDLNVASARLSNFMHSARTKTFPHSIVTLQTEEKLSAQLLERDTKVKSDYNKVNTKKSLHWAYEHIYLPRRTERKGAPPRRRSRLDMEAGIGRFIQLIGDKDIREVTRPDAERFVQSLNSPSVGTTKKAIGVLSALFNSAVEREVIGRNPFRGVGPDRYTVMSSRRGYRRFDAEQLTRLFANTEQKSGAMLWVPRLLLLTGARLEEMAQLRAAWFTTRDGIDIIDLHDAQVKTPHSRRYVPLHRDLLRLGILEYVSRADDRLFPKLAYRRTSERWGASLSTRLNREIDATIGKDRTLTVHSLRKTFEHAAYTAGIPKPSFNAIAGHKAADVSEEHYLQLQDDIALLKRHLDTLDFSYLFRGPESLNLQLNED